MNMSNRQSIFWVCIFLFALAGCATLKDIIQEPAVSFKDVSPQNMSLSEGSFLFNFNVSNPNSFGLTLSKISYDLRINERNFIKDTLENGIKVPAEGSAVMSIPVTVRYADLFGSLKEALGSDSIAYALNGTVGIGPLSIPYKHQGNLDMPKLPSISLQDISIEKLSLDGAVLNVSLKLANPNDFNVNLKGLNYAVKLHGKEFAKGLVQNVTPITANSENLLNLNLDVNFKELGRSAMAIINGAGTDYELKGNFLINTPGQTDQRIPFLKSGQVPLR